MSLSQDFLKYSALDSACTFEVYQKFWPELDQGFQPAYDMTIALGPVLTWMQHRGIRVDQAKLKETREDILQTAGEKQRELNALCGRELNVNSSKDCQRYFYVEKGIPPYYNEGSVTVDDLALQRIARGTARRAGLREAKLVQDVRGLQKLYSTYLSMEFDADGRFRSSYNPRGCLLPETEVLTPDGWIALQNFQSGMSALQWHQDGTLTWTIPEKVEYDVVDESMISCASEQHTCVYTRDHRIPSYQPNTTKFEVRTAEQTSLTYRQLPVGGILNATGQSSMLYMARIIAMIQADGCMSEGSVVLTFKKDRKVRRCRWLLDLLNIPYTNPQGGEGYTRFVIGVHAAKPFVNLLGKQKLFGPWLLSWDTPTMEAFLTELQHWDGSIDQGRNVVRYVTKHENNATWVATLAHLCGKSSYTTKIFENQDRNPLWRVSIKDKSRVSLKEHYWENYQHTGKVFCLITTTGFFLARHKGSIFVTGNTKFGRLSSSKTIFGTGGNAQNLDPTFKRFLVPDPGYVFWEIDKRQAEWIVVAYLTGDANMVSIVESGRDTHIHTAALMLSETSDIPYEDCWTLIEHEAKLVGGNSDPDLIRAIREGDELLQNFLGDLPRTMSSRQRGKKSNHGLNYDEGYRKYALINELEESEGRRDVELYHRIYPGIRIWYESVKRQLQRDRSLTNCFGRRVRFMDAWGPDLWKAAYSFLPQSSVVDSLNIGLVKIYHDELLCDSSAANIDVLAQVHDSVLMQVPLQTLAGSAFPQLLERAYEHASPPLTYNGRTFQIATDSKLGLNWGGAHPEQNPLGMRDLKRIEDLPKLVELFRAGME